jgi:hypothetical protein
MVDASGSPGGKGPPDNVSGSELFLRLSGAERPHKMVPFPRRAPEGKPPFPDVAVVVLTEAELMRARAQAELFAKQQFASAPELAAQGKLGYETIWNNEIMVEVLCLACRDKASRNFPNSYTFPSPQHARQYVTSDEFAVLFREYCAWQRESGPILSGMTVADMDAWTDRLVEGAGSLPLSLLSSEQKDDLLTHIVSRLRTSRTGSGSPTGQPGDSSSDPPGPWPTGSETPSRPATGLAADAEAPVAEEPPPGGE